jgi:hypothetical protein
MIMLIIIIIIIIIIILHCYLELIDKAYRMSSHGQIDHYCIW